VASTLTVPPVANSRSQPADTILLVEDDRDIARMYRRKLQYDGYRVHVAMTGEMALALAFQSRADLVLLDMGLPTMDGLQVLTALRADRRTSSLPVVILSNCDDPDLVERGLQLGAIDYLIKSRITPTGVSGRIAGWMAAQAACDAHLAAEYQRASAVSAPGCAMPSGARTPPES
jgi:PleD family two-component response regulator